jgi:hypothetical protein
MNLKAMAIDCKDMMLAALAKAIVTPAQYCVNKASYCVCRASRSANKTT